MDYDEENTNLLAKNRNVGKQMTLTGDFSLVDPGFNNPPDNPFFMLQKWLELADRLRVSEPKGLILSTVDSDGQPSSRVVLLKKCDKNGVIFGTSQESTKGKDLESNPWAAGTFWWRETIQQINFKGRTTKLSKERSDELFQERTRDAQAIAVASRQSAPLINEQELRAKVLKLVRSNDKIERPDKWHAYHLALESIEFWHGSKDRFHKRLRYDLVNGSWHYQKLHP